MTFSAWLPVSQKAWMPRSAACSTGTLNALDQVELAIMRLGTCELLNRPDVPYRVVIDEYVELAKVFGAEQSYRYVNGVLDKVAKRVRGTERRAGTGKTG